MSTKTRKNYQNVLKTHGHSINIEKQIFDTCKRISKEEDIELEYLYNKITYEKLGEIIENPNLIKEIKDDIKNNILDWDSVIYKDYRDDMLKENSDHIEGVKVQKGAFKCNNPKCRSDETYYYQSQTRSADEGSTTHVVCSKCGCRYTFC